MRLSVTTTPAARPSSTSTRVTRDSSKRVNRGLARVTSPNTTSDPDQTRLPSSRRCTASGIRCTRVVAMRPASSAAASAFAHERRVGRAVERVGRHAQKPLRLGEQLVEAAVGVEDRDPLAVVRPRARAGPVRSHAADVARHGRHGQAVLAVDLVAALEQERARSGAALRGLDDAAGAIGALLRVRTLRPRLRAGALGGIGDVLHVRTRRVRDGRADLEQRDRGARRPLAQDARVGGAGRAAADDRDIHRLRVAARHACAATSRM